MRSVKPAQIAEPTWAKSPAGIQICLLGPLLIVRDTNELTISSRKSRALIAYLASREGTEITRSVLAGLLWSDRSDTQAGASLRQALSEVRQAFDGFGASPLRVTNTSITWLPGSASIDAKSLEKAVDSEDVDQLRSTAELVRGEFLEGLHTGSAGFEEWLGVERERTRLLACKLFQRLMENLEHHGIHGEAISAGLRLLALDPLQEHVHRALMRLYMAQGRSDAALAQFEKCREVLRQGLDVEPQHETVTLAREVRSRRGERPKKAARGAGLHGLETRGDDRPSVVLLPFANLSGDPAQQYLADGFTEDVITELSRYRSLLVIARSSSFNFRHNSDDARAVGQALGVGYVVTGNLRLSGNRIRVSVQLIDAVTQAHVWGDRFDSEGTDVFDLQERLARAIASTLEGRIAASDAESSRRKSVALWAAYDHFLQGREEYHRYRYVEAEPFLARACEIDPNYARAHALRAKTLLGRFWRDLDDRIKDEACACAETAIRLDDIDPWAQMAMGFTLTHCGKREEAGPYFTRAVALNPADVQISYTQAWWLSRVDRFEEALKVLDDAILHDPFPPNWYWEVRGRALFGLRRYDEVIESLLPMTPIQPWDYAYMAASHAYCGRVSEAKVAMSKAVQADPKLSISRYAKVEGYTSDASLAHLLNGFRKAGLAE
jgi:TolB-like protein